MEAPLPVNEAERLDVLYEHNVLDTAPEEEFDDLVRLAAHVCGVPIAAVSLIDEHRQWFKSIIGLDITETPREAAFCAYTILQPSTLIVPDAQTDPRFADNPLVTNAPGIRFYAGVPLITEEGHALGSLCVIDRIPRQITSEQQETLRLLARQATSHLKAARRVAEREQLIREKEHLLAEKEHLAAIIASSNDAIYAKTLDGYITSWNPAAEYLYGYTANEMIGRHIDTIVPPERHQEIATILAAIRRGATVAPEDTVRVTKAGTRVEVSLRVSPLHDTQGKIVEASVIAHDITARKQAERALQAEREFTHALLESLQEGIVACDAHGTLAFFNRTSRQFHGLPEQPLPPEQWAQHFDLYEADGVTPMQTQDIPLFRAFSGETVREAEMVIAPKFGSARTLLASGQAIYGPNGERLGAVAAMHDITARRQAEQEIARLASIVDSSEEAIISGDLEGIILSWNRGAERLYGYTAAEIIGQHVSLLALPGEISPVPAVITRLLHGEAVVPIEVLRRRQDGTEFYASLSFSPIRNIQERIVGLSCIARDITAQKRAEDSLAAANAALAESETRFRTSVTAMEEGMALQDADGAILMCNESAERILGLTADQMAGRTSLDPRWRAVHEDGTEFPGDQHPAMVVLREGTPQRNIIMGVHKPSGELTWVNINAVPLSLAGQEYTDRSIAIHGVVVTFTDVTERKYQEEALRQSAATLRAVLESAPVILYAADAEGTVTLSEGTGLAALGLKPGEVVGRSVYEFSGGDAEIVAYTRRALVGEAASYDAQYAGLCLHTELQPMRDASETVTGIIGVCFDITERVASEERFRVLFEESSDAHLLLGEDGTVDCNPAAVAMFGCADKTQLLSLHPATMSPEFQPDGRRSQEKKSEMDRLAYEHGFHRFEWVLKRTDGEEFPVEVSLTPVTLADRPVLLVVLHDLTERKRAEQQVKDYAVLLEFQKNELEKSNRELEEVNAQLEDLATTDGLTGLYNHRAFQERLAEEVSRAARYSSPLSLVLLDVDSFKSYNDTHGHPAGDAVLKTVASVLQSCARDTDLVARYGGEEFVFILTQTDLYGAATFAERLRTEIESYPWPVRAVTASFGVASLHAANESGADLVVRADAALYRAKKEGRNRVICDQASSLRRTYSQSVETTLLNK